MTSNIIRSSQEKERKIRMIGMRRKKRRD